MDQTEFVEIPTDVDANAYGPDTIRYMADVVLTRYLNAEQAGEKLDVKGNNFRVSLRRGSEGSELVKPIVIGRQELYLDYDVLAYKERREEIKSQRATKKTKSKGRSQMVLTRNLLLTLAQHLELDGFSRMDRGTLFNTVSAAIMESVDAPEDVDITKMSFVDLITLVTDIIAARQATEDDSEDDEGYDVDDLADQLTE